MEVVERHRSLASTVHLDDDQLFCECQGEPLPPPPIFNIPPPPTTDQFSRSEKSLESNSIVRAAPLLRGLDCAPNPRESCPVSSFEPGSHDAAPPGLKPPTAALIAAAFSAILIAVVLIVSWRYRRQKRCHVMVGSAKEALDMTNGIIYEDMPIRPSARDGLSPFPSQGHRSNVALAPMELLDLKTPSPIVQKCSCSVEGLKQCGISPFVNENRLNLYYEFSSTLRTNSNGGSRRLRRSPGSQNTLCSDMCVNTSATTYCEETVLEDFLYNSLNSEATSYGLGGVCDPLQVKNGLSSRSATLDDFYEKRYSLTNMKDAESFRSSQEIYNPTYEEISAATEVSSSVTSGSSVDRGSSLAHSSPIATQLASEAEETIFPDHFRNIYFSKSKKPLVSADTFSALQNPARSQYRKRQNTPKEDDCNPVTDTGSSYLTRSADFHRGAGDHPRVPERIFYTTQGTSDGRTSTSSSSDLPTDKVSREARYYVGGNLRPKSPIGPGISRSQVASKDSLPPLPSRTDRYRIFFTAERTGTGSLQGDSKTVGRCSRKRRYDSESGRMPESLYHEL